MKCGIEIHQRLATHKLFCNCPSEISETAKPVMLIKRRQHPVLSELGEIDTAAQFEYLRGRTYFYEVYPNCCEVELDEEPPHPLNPEALEIALEICIALNARIVDEVHVMRKTVIDGSNTAGFQRTAVIGLGGELETSKGKIGISTICLEEESAGIVREEDGKITYRLDRLGIPLIEIATSADIQSGEHAREVAEKLGMLLRIRGKVMRGIGSIRQDINVSTEKGARVEIKGVQELAGVKEIVENEVRRQEKLLEVLEELKKRGKIEIPEEVSDVSDIFANTAAKFLQKKKIFALKLPKHAGILGKELLPGRRYGTELSDYAKGAGVKGIIHSDEELAKYGISEAEAEGVRKRLGAKDENTFILVASEEKIAKKALALVRSRALMDYVPEETRRALPDRTTAYMRPLPGGARMYPETDIPPVRIRKEMLEGIKRGESVEEKRAMLMKLLPADLANKMLKSRYLPLFEKLVSAHKGVEATLIASTLENTFVSLRREGVEIKDAEGVTEDLFSEYEKKKFVKAAIPEILREMSKGKSAGEAVRELKLERISGEELKKLIAEEGRDLKRIMSKYRLRVDAKEVQELLEK